MTPREAKAVAALASFRLLMPTEEMSVAAFKQVAEAILFYCDVFEDHHEIARHAYEDVCLQ